MSRSMSRTGDRSMSTISFGSEATGGKASARAQGMKGSKKSRKDRRDFFQPFWDEMRECQSIVTPKDHFTQFAQFCRSAELIPFLQRCYRRMGIVGFLPRSVCGGPHLVIPTLADFPYGHAFPFYSCLQYYYGGVKTLHVSAVPADQRSGRQPVRRGPHGGPRTDWLTLPADKLAALQQERHGFGDEVSSTADTSTEDGDAHRDRTNSILAGITRARQKSIKKHSTTKIGHRLSAAKVKSFVGSAVDYLMGGRKKDGNLQGEEEEAIPGILPATDPFFGFVQAAGGINSYMYPSVPMQSQLKHIRQKDLKYSFRDILSREPSFDPLGDDEYECKDHQDRKSVV